MARPPEATAVAAPAPPPAGFHHLLMGPRCSNALRHFKKVPPLVVSLPALGKHTAKASCLERDKLRRPLQARVRPGAWLERRPGSQQRPGRQRARGGHRGQEERPGARTGRRRLPDLRAGAGGASP